MPRLYKLFVGGLVIMITLNTKSHAQLSPGDVHRSHAFLDGVENCNTCHDRESGQMHSKCLACHTEMKARIDNRRGLHANPEYRNCESCHSEHHGRNFDLIFWKDGEQGFDHRLAGYDLRGKHAKAACRACHKPDFIKDAEQLRVRQKDLSRTYLGLDSTCVSCHWDEHRGQLTQDCARCHTFDGWTPAPGFDHSLTKFALTGLHEKAACGKCHSKVDDPSSPNDPSYLKFANVRHENCTDCHKDAHDKRFGPRCEGCHGTSGWAVASGSDFDHSKTRYSLDGRHKVVTCDKCHPAGKPKTGLRFGSCRDCHQDRHKGEFADRPRGGACEECHTTAGFAPALFSVEQHQLTRFALRESHLAVPCLECHGNARRDMYTREGNYTWTTIRCQSCHRDVHMGQLAKIVDRSGCEGCHSEATWNAIQFSHDSTGFALSGKHTSVVCASCHHGQTDSGVVARLGFKPLLSDCESCHRDVHRGQFVTADSIPGVRCERCHTTANWQATLFDHSKLTDYPLDGAHANVPCAECHKSLKSAAIALVDFQINDKSCRACHGTDDVTSKGRTP